MLVVEWGTITALISSSCTVWKIGGCMILSQLLSPRDLLSLNADQLDRIDGVIEAEIIKSDEIMRLLKTKLEKEYLPAIQELKKQK
jgi:hypothetical protein